MNAPDNLCVICFKQKSYDEAFRYFSQATEVDPAREYIPNNLGMVYSDMGMYEEAKADFERAVSKPIPRNKELRARENGDSSISP